MLRKRHDNDTEIANVNKKLYTIHLTLHNMFVYDAESICNGSKQSQYNYVSLRMSKSLMNFATFIAFIKPSAALMTTTRTTEEQYRGRYTWPLHLVHQRRGRVGAILSVAVLNVSSDSQQTSAVYQLHVTSYTVAWHKSAR